MPALAAKEGLGGVLAKAPVLFDAIGTDENRIRSADTLDTGHADITAPWPRTIPFDSQTQSCAGCLSCV